MAASSEVGQPKVRAGSRSEVGEKVMRSMLASPGAQGKTIHMLS